MIVSSPLPPFNVARSPPRLKISLPLLPLAVASRPVMSKTFPPRSPFAVIPSVRMLNVSESLPPFSVAPAEPLSACHHPPFRQGKQAQAFLLQVFLRFLQLERFHCLSWMEGAWHSEEREQKGRHQ